MIGIDVSDKSIKVVRLADNSSRKLLSHCSEPLEPGWIESGAVINPEKVRGAVKSALDACQIDKKVEDAVVASISESQSFLRVIELPLMREDEVGEAIKWEIAQHIPFGLENVYIDWQPLHGEGHVRKDGKMEVQVGASQKKVVDSLLRVFSDLNLDVAAFELESQALVRALVSRDMRRKQGILIVDVGASATNVIVHDHGALRFTASLQKGVNSLSKVLSAEQAKTVSGKDIASAQIPSAEALSASLAPALEELAIEIHGIVEFYNSIDAKHVVKEIMMTGGGSNLPGLDKALLRYFDKVIIQQGNPWVNIVQAIKSIASPLELKESVRFSTAIGLALRPVVY